MPRFVVLQHETHTGVHWDFMLEDEGGLLTWALSAEPQPAEIQPAKALPPHRPIYLDYEGPISGNRGQVRQWDRGEFRWLSRSGSLLEVVLRGNRVNGLVRLSFVGPSSEWWQFEWQPSQKDAV